MFRIFKHYIPKWAFLLVWIEYTLFTLSVFVGVSLRFLEETQPDEIHAEGLLPKAIFFAGVMVISMAATGRYQRIHDNNGLGPGFIGEIFNVILSFVIGLVAMSLFFYVFPDLFIGRGAFGYATLTALLSILLIRRFFLHYLLDLKKLKRRLLVYGAGDNAKIAGKLLEKASPDRTFLGYWPEENHPININEQKIVSHHKGLEYFVKIHRINEIVIALDTPLAKKAMSEILDCKEQGCHILDLSDLFERERRLINIDILEVQWWVFQSDGLNNSALTEISKKTFDIFISLLLLAISWPIMLLTSLAIWIECRGREPILYRQERVGYGGKIFQVMKFRSMRSDAESDGIARWAQKNDHRITRVGHFIRKTRIDELPQFFNVLNGEMSLVGPRPERPYFVNSLKKRIPYYTERLRVKPGITGWAQVCYGYGASEKDAAEKLKYDLYYVKNRSIFFDMLVLIHSVGVVLFGRGATPPPPKDEEE
ncbi:TIGR03013 family XrtA/PEP-CTERM system glycosyltransferase [Magnetococcales bacterium HHB-1]